MNNRSLKVLRVVTISDAFIHIKGQLEIFKTENRDIKLLSASGNLDDLIQSIELPFEKIYIRREITPLSDLITIAQLIKIMLRDKPDIIHSSTPKAGLVCSIAAFIARVPIRIHTFTGQRWATLRGVKREVLKKIDKLIVLLCTRVYSDSESQNSFLIDQGIVSKEKVSCIHKGSFGGIDPNRFCKNNVSEDIREKLSIPKDAKVLLFLGRVVKDKGIEELVRAYDEISKNNKNIYLLIVGPSEPDLDPPSAETLSLMKKNSSIKVVGSTDRPQDFFSGADILCLPSYREGFGTVVLEAAAMGVPTIGTRIPGLIDSIVDEKTGLLVAKQSVEELKKAIIELCENDGKRLSLGRAAQERALEDFDYKLIARKQWDEYLTLFQNR